MISERVSFKPNGRVNVYRIRQGEPADAPSYDYVLVPQTLWDSFETKVKTQVETRSKVFGPAFLLVDGRQMRTGYARSIKSDPKPDPLYDESSSKKRAKSGKYPPRDKSIVMNPYEVAHVSVTQVPGDEVISEVPLSSDSACYKSLGVPWYKVVVVNGLERCFLDDRHFVFGQTGIVVTQNITKVTSRWSMPYEIGPVPTAATLKTLLLQSYEMDVSLVQAAEAAANERFLDLTTELAELPETIKMVLGGFRTVARLVVDVKKKEFYLSKAFEQRKKKAKIDLDRALSSINMKRKGANKHLMRVLKQQERKARKTFALALARTAREFTDAIASLWLQFRYGIMPVVYSIDSVKALIKSLGSEYITTRERDRPEVEIDLPSEIGGPIKFPTTHRVTIKQRYDSKETTWEDVLDRLSGNLLLTAWELIPLSFVVDWFIDVGNFLSSLNPTAEWDEQARSYSVKIEHTRRVQLENGSALIIHAETYKRELIPNDCITGLTLGDGLNLFRSYDALALLWSPIKALLISSKKG